MVRLVTDRILAGIARHKALAQAATAGPWSSYFGRVRRNDKTDLLLDNTDLLLVTTAGRYSDSAYVAAKSSLLPARTWSARSNNRNGTGAQG